MIFSDDTSLGWPTFMVVVLMLGALVWPIVEALYKGL